MGKGQPIDEACTRLANALSKVYRDKNMAFEFKISKHCLFHGDSSDILELLGNLLDNACKYGGGKVKITGKVTDNKVTGNTLTIVIEDNGQGVTENHRRTIIKRGARADTAESGQGIGLAVVVDIISSYNGSLHIEDSELGGAAFVIELPIAQA
jgi:two-component system sensor histidine kinase PhoQ